MTAYDDWKRYQFHVPAQVAGDLYAPSPYTVQVVPPGYDFPNPGPLTQEMTYPGHGIPPRRGEDRPGLSPWARLARGCVLGKKSVLVYSAEDLGKQHTPVDILNLRGDDLDAQPLVVTLAPPLVIPLAFSPSLFLGREVSAQNTTGEQGNAEFQTNFPGTASPVAWPPFDAVVEWGVGGVSTKASVDFTNGATVPNLVASWIRVHAIVPRASALTGTSALYVLYAFVGPGPGTGNAQRTVWVGDLSADAESDASPVPRFARRAYVVGADPSATPAATACTLRLWQDAAKTSNVANFTVTAGQPLPFDLPNGAMFASVRNDMDVSARFGIVYHLSI